MSILSINIQYFIQTHQLKISLTAYKQVELIPSLNSARSEQMLSEPSILDFRRTGRDVERCIQVSSKSSLHLGSRYRDSARNLPCVSMTAAVQGHVDRQGIPLLGSHLFFNSTETSSFGNVVFSCIQIPDDGESLETQWFWVLYTIVRTL
jgi:hypothetical protein